VRVALDAGTPASKNGVFKTNFPLNGGKFERTTFCERKYVGSRAFPSTATLTSVLSQASDGL
jgi:hypothetical protein